MENGKVVPIGWTVSSLGKIAKWGSGGTPKSTIPEYYGGNIPWIIIGDLNDGYIDKSSSTITELGLDNSSAKIVKPESVLVAMYGSIGKLGINKIPLATNQAIAFTEELYEIVTNKYLFRYLFFIRPELNKMGQGGTQKNISQTILKEIKIPIPPIMEQHRIVAKIEELFSELDKGIENLKVAKQQLKVYRQAVLKWAFEGKLTEGWRNKQKNLLSTTEMYDQIKRHRVSSYNKLVEEWKVKLKEFKPNKPKKFMDARVFDDMHLDKFPRLPYGWCYVGIESMLSLRKKGMITGPFGSSLKKSDYRKIGIPVFGIENIGQGMFIPGNKIFVDIDKAKELSAFQASKGDIIISRSGTVGEICCIPEGVDYALISTNLMMISLNEEIVNSKYFTYLFQSKGIVIDQVKEMCKGSTRDFLNQTILKSIVFPLPRLEEQNLIISEIESRLSVCDRLDQSISESLHKAEALRQSILKKAFEGKLVPQDPNDEPAEKLLERIRSDKDASEKQSKVSKRRTKQ